MSVKDLFDLRGKVAVVTGGSRGIGLQMAEALGEMGARVAITARKADELDEARAHLDAMGIECLCVAGDLAQFATIPALVDAVLDPVEPHRHPRQQRRLQLGRARRELSGRRLAQGDEPQHRRAVLPDARDRPPIDDPAQERQDREHRVDRRALRQSAGMGMETIAYNTSKGALVQLTRALAAEWGGHNINVNAICPGFFPSKMTQVTLDRITTSVLELTPLGRLGGDEDLKGSVVYLASEASRHVTGQVIAVDGGCTII